ncbi:membrane fusion protein (multidrug efflux system) [Desulfosalsimonas propionicica]|uniref:Membrane fusion protein (Multidrug efflux system) n=1 Tax=Desulfosalsimonas propionicica TaxID=332175 RepID=A0A7W0CAL2_9BACT|nr:efflux RND transporter periplasmic adaptor subunit [Desulfosalsimonas propionicica]MBA2882188.1 membrane fusion protein (multidrug efflux system) [Desulfosalsimonas propionicica]
MKTRSVLIALLLIFAAAAGAYVLYSIFSGSPDSKESAKPKKIPVVETAAAVETTVFQKLDLTGSVEAYRVAHLASPAEGPVENIFVREGDRVRAGDQLALIGRRQGAEARIAFLLEEVKKEEANLGRTRRLVETSALAKERLDQARASCESARSQLVQAQESAMDHTVSAPWDGVVSRLEVKTGEFVAPRTMLMELYDPDSLVIRAAVPERYAAQIHPDMDVEIRLDAFSGKTFQGRIQKVYPYLDARLRTRTVEIVPEKAIDLLPGMFARLQIILKKHDNAVVVPKDAVFSDSEGPAVFVVKDQKAVKRRVKTGITEKQGIEITKGVNPDDQVIVAGRQKLKNGDAVALTKGRTQ